MQIAIIVIQLLRGYRLSELVAMSGRRSGLKLLAEGFRTFSERCALWNLPCPFLFLQFLLLFSYAIAQSPCVVIAPLLSLIGPSDFTWVCLGLLCFALPCLSILLTSWLLLCVCFFSLCFWSASFQVIYRAVPHSTLLCNAVFCKVVIIGSRIPCCLHVDIVFVFCMWYIIGSIR